MCNAWNHPANCRCGFGGEGHAGRTSLGAGSHYFHGVPRILRAYESYVNPNARCPVCGAAVFFYQSPDGGRVFFDELGPPWPKHPCTDRNSTPARLDPSSIDPKAMPDWKQEGWTPFFMTDAMEWDGLVYKLKGTLEESSITIYVRKDACPLITSRDDFKHDTIAFIRSTAGDSFELSLLSRLGIDATISAFSSLSMAHEGRRVEESHVRPKTTTRDDAFMGKVKWFNNVRRYGFISLDGSKDDIFLHASALQRSGVSAIQQGQRVRVFVRTGRKGKEARAIEIL